MNAKEVTETLTVEIFGESRNQDILDLRDLEPFAIFSEQDDSFFLKDYDGNYFRVTVRCEGKNSPKDAIEDTEDDDDE